MPMDAPVVTGVGCPLDALMTMVIPLGWIEPPLRGEMKRRGRPVGSRKTKGRKSGPTASSGSREAVIVTILADGEAASDVEV